MTEDIRLIYGNCLVALYAMESGSVDAVITDPPYGVELVKKRTKRRDGSTHERHGSYSFPDTREYIKTLVVPAIRECLRIARTVVVTPGTKNMWLYPEPVDVGCFYSAAGNGMGLWGFRCSQPILFYGKDPYQERRLGCRPNSCGQTYPNDANKVDHPCAKPIRWARWLVERATLPGMTILDPFMGSGTTGVAALLLGRKFIGCEINPDYFAIAKKRIAEAQNAFPLFAGLS